MYFKFGVDTFIWAENFKEEHLWIIPKAKELGFESVTYKQIWEGNVRHTSNRVKAGGKWYYVDCSINRGTTYDLFETTDPYQENPDAVV